MEISLASAQSLGFEWDLGLETDLATDEEGFGESARSFCINFLNCITQL